MQEVVGSTLTHRDWLNYDLPILDKCQALLRLPGESVGADIEVRHANASHIPVFHTIADLEHWRREEEQWIALHRN